MTEKEYFQAQSSKSNDDTFDLKKLLLRFLRNWYYFVICGVVFLTLAFFYVKYATPTYSVTSEILIKNDEEKPDFGNSSPFKNLDIFKGAKNIDNEIEVLTSHGLMVRTLNSLFLTCSFYVDDFPVERELYGDEVPIIIEVDTLLPEGFKRRVVLDILSNKQFKLTEKSEEGKKTVQTYDFGESIKTDYSEFRVYYKEDATDNERPQKLKVQFNSLDQLANYYLEDALSVGLVSNESSVIRVTLQTSIPRRGKRLVDRLISMYKQEDIEDKNLAAESTFNFIDERLQGLTQELDEVEASVETFKRSQDIADVDAATAIYSEQAQEYNRKETDIQIQLDVLNSLEEYLRSNNGQVAPSSLGITDPTLNQLLSKFNSLQTEKQRLLQTLPPQNPLVVDVEEQLQQTRRSVLSNLQNVKNGLNVTLRNLRENSQRYSSRVNAVPTIQRRLTEISRDQGVMKELYLFLLQRREESALSLASAVSSSRVIDDAIVSDQPLWPKKKIVFLVAMVLAMVLPAGVILARTLLDDRIQDKKDVQEVLDIPILGEVIKGGKNKLLAVSATDRTPSVELFRLLRSNFEFYSQDKNNQVVMVTSSAAGEGKTFISVNLAASFALLGKKVLIVSLDLRKTGLLRNLGVSVGNGVTDYLVDSSILLDDLIRPVNQQENLYVMGSGTIPPNPAELLKSEKLAVLIQELRKRFDYIFLDTSPIGQVADAYALKPLVDATLFVMRYKYTQKDKLTFVNELAKRKMLKDPMVVVNYAAKRTMKYGYEYRDRKPSKK